MSIGTQINSAPLHLFAYPLTTRFAPEGRKKEPRMAEKTERIVMRVTPEEKALLKQRQSETTLKSVSDYIRNMTFGYKIVSNHTTQEKQLLGEVKAGLNQLQRLRNLVHKDARPQLLFEMESIIKDIKKIIHDWES